MRTVSIHLVALAVITGCVSSFSQDQLINEVKTVENQFMNSVEKNGIHQGFLEFAAKDAIIIRNSKATEGREAIRDRFSKSSDTNQQLTWTPRKIEVAQSGDLAYSFGDFEFTVLDSLGNKEIITGNYCTIWKRQADGRWKFVID